MKKGCRKFSSKVDENLSSSLSSSSVPDAAPAERSSALTVRMVWICFVKRKNIVTVVGKLAGFRKPMEPILSPLHTGRCVHSVMLYCRCTVECGDTLRRW
jgi:hypothetical protein